VPQLRKGVDLARILITGVSGFVGKHLVRELTSQGHEITGIGLQPEANSEIASRLAEYTPCDLTDPEQIRRIPLDEVTGVISLAGLAQAGASFSEPEKYKQVNVKVFSVLGERILKENLPIRVLAVSTGAVYDSNQPLPLSEESALTDSGSPYAQSKILMERRAAELRSGGLDCVVVRPFNHIGPGQEPGFLVPDLFKKTSGALETGEPVKVGSLQTRRDYTDVRDVVRAYADLISQPALQHEVYNVSSGRGIAGQQILDMILIAMGAEGRVQIEIDKELIRPGDPAELYGSHERLSRETGWQPKIDVERTISDFVDSARG
jgi:GDP-4-dehydro-6-deoxy-D-mannose reductase